MFIKIYVSFIIQVREGKCRIFWVITGVQTDDCSGPGTADNVDKWNCKHHKWFHLVFGCILFELLLSTHWLLPVLCHKPYLWCIPIKKVQRCEVWRTWGEFYATSLPKPSVQQIFIKIGDRITMEVRRCSILLEIKLLISKLLSNALHSKESLSEL